MSGEKKQLYTHFIDVFFIYLDEVAKKTELENKAREFSKRYGIVCKEPQFDTDNQQVLCPVEIELEKNKEELIKFLNPRDYAFLVICPFKTNTKPKDIPSNTKMLRRVKELVAYMGREVELIDESEECLERYIVRIPILVDKECALVLELYDQVETCA